MKLVDVIKKYVDLVNKNEWLNISYGQYRLTSGNKYYKPHLFISVVNVERFKQEYSGEFIHLTLKNEMLVKIKSNTYETLLEHTDKWLTIFEDLQPYSSESIIAIENKRINTYYLEGEDIYLIEFETLIKYKR